MFASKTAELLAFHQVEFDSIYPKEGWVEQDPKVLLSSVYTCMEQTLQSCKDLQINPADIKVWLDTRTKSTVEKFVADNPKSTLENVRSMCGLPINTYFSAVKLKWLIDNCEKVKKAVDEERCLFGTVDSWLLWNMTGGVSGGVHVTDITNASRTMLMSLKTESWDPYLCKLMDHLKGLPYQEYGTGCFLLYNTGLEPILSENGLLTTVAYKMGPDQPTFFALEGSVAIAGAAVQWLRDNLNMLQSSSEIESLSKSVSSSAGVYFVPAFSGLYAPYWQMDARGLIIGLTQFTNKAHIARATLEAVCFQTRELLDAMNEDCGIPLASLLVDGGMTVNNLLMQLQADVLGINVERPTMPETTALGAAMAAGAAKGIEVWKLNPEDKSQINTDVFTPTLDPKGKLWC
ncbi:hypothetical protein QZH41_016705 [Actinostola sp. cb2023]|nr:hypothetical protein QZH41_016705 [Actinostola sp. cb2023]